MAGPRSAILLTNARVYDHSASSAGAFQDSLLIEDGKIKHVGSSDSPAIQEYRNRGVSTSDLGGKYILPGFIDGHCHFLLLGQSFHKLDLDGCKNLQDIRSRIKAYAKQNPTKARILVRGWMHSMTNAEAKASMLDDLDPRPIYIESKDLHSTWCNSAALKELSVQNMPDPAGGSIERDAQGNASGLLSEASVLQIVWPFLARETPLSEKTAALKSAISAYHSVGYTGCIDMAMDEDAWAALLALREELGGTLPIRIAAHWAIIPGESEEYRLQQVDRVIEFNKQYNIQTSPDLRIVGIKIICDGVIDACTAALSQPYTSNGISCDPLWTPEMLDPVVAKASQANLQCALHAIGDLAVNNAINVISRHGRPDQRHRIEHLELTSPEDAQRLGKLGIIASIQPVHADPSILRAWPKLIGPERLKRAFAYKEFSDHGATLAIGSDSPGAPHDPIKNLYVATTRKSAKQPEAGDLPVNEHFKIGIIQAVTAATRGVAYSFFAEKRLGSLEIGKEADFAIVDMSLNADELLRAKVTETWVGGKKVFEAEKGRDARL